LQAGRLAAHARCSTLDDGHGVHHQFGAGGVGQGQGVVVVLGRVLGGALRACCRVRRGCGDGSVVCKHAGGLCIPRSLGVERIVYIPMCVGRPSNQGIGDVLVADQRVAQGGVVRAVQVRLAAVQRRHGAGLGGAVEEHAEHQGGNIQGAMAQLDGGDASPDLTASFYVDVHTATESQEREVLLQHDAATVGAFDLGLDGHFEAIDAHGCEAGAVARRLGRHRGGLHQATDGLGALRVELQELHPELAFVVVLPLAPHHFAERAHGLVVGRTIETAREARAHFRHEIRAQGEAPRAHVEAVGLENVAPVVERERDERIERNAIFPAGVSRGGTRMLHTSPSGSSVKPGPATVRLIPHLALACPVFDTQLVDFLTQKRDVCSFPRWL